jgi:uncharacterized protein
MATKYVLFYTSADDVLTKAPEHFPAHSARLAEFHARGVLLAVGTFGDPQEQGSMGIFTTREAAEEFARPVRARRSGQRVGGARVERGGARSRCASRAFHGPARTRTWI